ncbi:molybdopterin-dependent oxidoreductase [Actinoplanes friuliensis]|uniref:Trimethylamine-N-oxide reductase (Cytochrome c) n=1 Tax=Actinoplanes friuliensis DSM 7358 TaxID=1246995 RepID=U5W728_9ACTN|nr:molybdopterin-dependent oxidoreductase [Actinoplanes friuliensis]AGZ44807.1 Trimethylamine-N-oxide reductase (cytochrome c) [Actinoplanes friuliensis DSM 7358]
MTTTSSSHWGAFRVSGTGTALQVTPRPGDPDPSPLLGNLAGAHRHRSRVARPALRRPRAGRGYDSFEEVSWDTALDHVAAELSRVREQHGDSAIFGGSYGWASAGRFHHAQSQLHRFLALGGGYTASRNSYSLGASLVALPHLVGRRGAHAVIREGTDWPVIAGHTDLIVAFGGIRTANTYVTPGGRAVHDFRGHLRAATARGLRVASVSPLRDDLSPELAGDWLAIRPGTDVAVMFALAHQLAADGHADLAFLDRFTVGGDRFLADVKDRTPAWAAGVSGLSEQSIVDLARRMAAGRTLVTVSWSLQRTPYGEQPLWAGLALAAVLGQIGLPGGGFGHGYGSMGDVGGGALPYGLPTFPQVRNPVADFIPCARVADLLLHPGTEFDYDGERYTYPDTRLVYWAGGNPFHHHQDLSRLRRAFARPETVIVHEPYWTATARHADVVLPVTTTLERDDLGAGRGDTHLIAMQRADEPYAQARDEYDIFAGLAARLGYHDAFTEGRTSGEWVRHLYEGWRVDRGLPGFDDFWSAGEVVLPGRRENTVLFEDFRAGRPLDTPSGRIELSSATVAGFGYEECPGHPVFHEPALSAYPLVLICNQPGTRLHSQQDMGGVSRASKVHDREPLRLHPADAAARGITDGDVARVFNNLGSLLAGVRLTDACAPGVAQLSTGAWFDPSAPDVATCVHGNPNVLTEDLGTSRLAQGCTGQHARVEITRHDGPLPAIRAFDPPLENQ